MPVQPVCPKDVPTGNRSPRFDDSVESMSHPRPRTSFSAARCRRRDHAVHGRGREHASPVQHPAVQQHPAESRQIGSRAEQTRVPGDIAHAAGGRIVDDAPQKRHRRLTTRPSERTASLRRRDPRPERFRRHEAGVAHLERLEDVRLRVPIQPLAGDARDDVAEQKEIDVAVDVALARRRRQEDVARAADRLVRPGEFRLQRQIRRQSRGVREQLKNRDRGLPTRGERRNEFRHRIAQPHASLLDQLHHARRGGHHLGERGQIEDRVLGHRLARRQNSTLAECLAVHHPIAVADQDDGARQLVPCDRGGDHHRNLREAGAVSRALVLCAHTE